MFVQTFDDLGTEVYNRSFEPTVRLKTSYKSTRIHLLYSYSTLIVDVFSGIQFYICLFYQT